jgi:hypothetical protein
MRLSDWLRWPAKGFMLAGGSTDANALLHPKRKSLKVEREVAAIWLCALALDEPSK